MTARRAVLRYEIPVDDSWHRVDVLGQVTRIGCRTSGVVEFWSLPPVEHKSTHDGMGRLISERFVNVRTDATPMWFRVFGTGQPVDGLYAGTTYDANPALVWRLFLRYSDPSAVCDV